MCRIEKGDKMTWRQIVVGMFIVFTTVAAAAAIPVSEIVLRTDADDARVRPLESIVVQLLIYGEVPDESGTKQQARIRKNGAKFTIKSSDGGWLSKPFRYQGTEVEPFYDASSSSLVGIIFGCVSEQHILQDSVLYTASSRTGKYRIEARLDGHKASLIIDVDKSAPSRKIHERVSFPSERRSTDEYRSLAEHYAPFIAQETWFQPKSDYITRFDFDGDWVGDNNWNSAETGTSQAYVYYAAMETETHWFLIYNMFHPRDYSDKCVAGSCHENDNEGLILTVKKDGSRWGRLQVMETLAHNNIYSFRNDNRVKGNVHGFDGKIEFQDKTHPAVFIESGGHGVYGTKDSHAQYDLRREKFKSGTGVTYIFKGRAERPRYANDRRVGYELLPIYEHWWLRAGQHRGGNRTFADYFLYQPYGRRPLPSSSEIAGAFKGRKMGSNKAKPFWGWHDERTRKKGILSRGQWGLDPAYSVSRNLMFPEPFSLKYLHNPYLVSQPGQTQVDGHGPVAASSTRWDFVDGRIQPRRSKDYNTQARKGWFDIRMRIDDTVLVYVQDDIIRYEIIKGKRPEDKGSEFTQPIPSAVFRHFQVKKKDGRGKVRLVESPSKENDFTAVLRFTDPKSGADKYHVRLEWEWDHRISSQSITPVSQTIDRTGYPLGEELYSEDNDPENYDSGKKGSLDFRGRIDDTVVFRIRGDRIFAHVLKGRPLRVDRFSFSQPLPSQRLKKIKIEKKDGRGKVLLLEHPNNGNGFTAVIRITDPKGGDDKYRFRLKWER